MRVFSPVVPITILGLVGAIAFGCGPGPGGGDGGLPTDGEAGPARPVLQQHWVELRRSPLEIVGHVVIEPAATGAPAGRAYQAVFNLDRLYLAASLCRGGASFRLRDRDGVVTPLTSPSCEPGPTGRVVRVPMPDAFLLARVDQYIEAEVELADDGRADTADGGFVVGTAVFTFRVSGPSGSISRAFLRPTAASVVRSAPGWDRPVNVGDAAGYLAFDPSAIRALEPLRAHDDLALVGLRRLPTPMGGSVEVGASLAHFSASAVPPDLEEGFAFVGIDASGGTVPLDGADHDRDVVGVEARSRVGLVPGERYDLLVVGEASTAMDGSFVPPTEDVAGRGFGAWGSSALIGAPRELGSRFAFEVDPIRIESPVDEAGVSSLVVVPDAGVGEIPVELVVRAGHPRVAGVGDIAITVEGLDASGVVVATSSTALPWEAAGTARDLVQAGLAVSVYDVRATVTLSGSGWPSATVLRVRARLEDKLGVFATVEDQIETTIIVPPALPAAVCPASSADGAPPSCVRVVDVDDRDCRIDSICISGGEPDLDRVRVEVCGVTHEVTLTEAARPAALGGGTWLCTGPVDGGVGGTAGSDPVALTPTDTAGITGRTVTLTPACYEPTRRLLGGDSITDLINFRDASGAPVVIHDEVDVGGHHLVLRRFDGTEWTRQVLVTMPADNFIRGRMDDEVLADGSRLFCMTTRGLGPVAPDSSGLGSGIRDLFATGGVYLGRINRDGTASIRRVGSAYGLGCALSLEPGSGRRVALAYAGPVSGLPVERRATTAVPHLRLCDSATGTCEPSSVVTFSDVAGARPLGIEPDVLWQASQIYIVGRGLQPPGSGAGFDEHAVYEIVTRPLISSTGATLRLIEGELVSGLIIESVGGALEPRLVATPDAPGGRTIVYYSYVWSRRCDPSCDAGVGTLRIVARPLSATIGPPTTLATISNLRAPPQRIFIRGGTRPSPSARPELSQTFPGMLEPEILPGWDVVTSSAGAFLHLAYTRRYVGGFFAPRRDAIGNAPVASTSSSWREVWRWSGGTLALVADSRHRIDVETGYERSSTTSLSLAVAPASGTDDPPSVAYDVVDVAPLRREIRFSDLRMGHWIDTPSGRGLAPRVPAGTCWDRRNAVPVLSGVELGLTPDVAVPTSSRPWASMRADTLRLVPNTTPANDYRDVTGNISCVLASALGVTPVDPALPAFFETTRDEVAGRLTGLAASLMGNNPAVVHSRSFSPSRSFGGSLRFEANGRTYRTGIAPLGTALDRLDDVLNATFTEPVHPWISVHVDADDASRARLAITMIEDRCVPNGVTSCAPDDPLGDDPCTPPLVRARRCDGAGTRLSPCQCVTSSSVSAVAGPATLRVLDGGLAASLGLPRGDGARASRGAWVDPSHGDPVDRFGPCSATESCVPDSAPGAADGTCGRVADCFAPGPLLSAYTDGARVRLGGPPVRPRQSGICVPVASPASSTPFDRCDDASRFSSGTNASHVSRLIFETGGVCPAGAARFTGPICHTCGLLPAPADPSVPAEGYVRLCTTHADCSVDIPCTDAANCRWRTDSYYCTHRGSPYLDVPAGLGFCARPLRSGCPNDTRVRIVSPRIESRPETAFTACGSADPRPGRTAEDFEPARLECVAAGCTMPIGRTVNGYCFASSDCPTNHECLVNSDVYSPAGFLRPLFSDPRFDDALRESGDAEPGRVQPQLLSIVSAATGAVRSGIGLAGRSIGGVIPRRLFGETTSGPATGRTSVDRLYYAVEALRADLGGVEIRPLVDVDPRPGAGDLEIRLGLRGRLEVQARLEGNATLLGVSHRLDTFVGVDAAVEGARVVVRPQTRVDARGVAHLGFRVVRAELLRHMGGANGDVPLQASDANLLFATQQGELVQQWVRFLFVGFIDGIFSGLVLELVLENLRSILGITPDEVVGVEELGDVFSTILFSPAGPFLLGEEISFDPAAAPLFDGAAIEAARDDVRGVRTAAAFPSLGMHVRGERWVIGDPSGTSTTVTPAAVRAFIAEPPGRGGFCEVLGYPDPNCLETPVAVDCVP